MAQEIDNLDYKYILNIFTPENFENLKRQHEEELITGRRKQFVP